MADLTPEQRAKAVKAIARAMTENAMRCAKGDPATGPATAALDAVLALGFRAPGPPTEEEVERAAAAICDARLWPGAWIKANEVESDNLRHEARTALTAALGRPE